LLIDLYKSFGRFKTDTEVANALGLKQNTISMVRKSKSGLGPLPRLRIFRDVWKVDIDELEEALESSEVMLNLLKNYIESLEQRRLAIQNSSAIQIKSHNSM
jgi:hypothetical protein